MKALDVHLMTMFLAVLATAPPVDTSLSLWGHLFNLFYCVCCGVCTLCNLVFSEKIGVYSEREEAEEGGNITGIDIKKSIIGDSITHIGLR